MTVFTLETLHLAIADPKPARLAVIGHPVAHSASPRMHQPALDEAHKEIRYVALEVPPGKVALAFDRMRDLGFIGCNVTVPHKFDALAACDRIENAALELGAVNTVRFEATQTVGTNTDGYGFEHALREDLGFTLAGASIFIAGAGGGAGGAIACHCARAGVARLILSNRTTSKLEPLAERVRKINPDLKLSILGLDDCARHAAGCNLVVNTSSLGLKPGDSSPIPAESFSPKQCVFDSIYQPPLTSFLENARAAGARIANGKGMLLHQGVAAFRFWFPNSEPTEAMRSGLG